LLDTARQLLKIGAQPTLAGQNGETPLEVAKQLGDLDMIRLLVMRVSEVGGAEGDVRRVPRRPGISLLTPIPRADSKKSAGLSFNNPSRLSRLTGHSDLLSGPQLHSLSSSESLLSTNAGHGLRSTYSMTADGIARGSLPDLIPLSNRRHSAEMLNGGFPGGRSPTRKSGDGQFRALGSYSQRIKEVEVEKPLVMIEASSRAKSNPSPGHVSLNSSSNVRRSNSKTKSKQVERSNSSSSHRASHRSSSRRRRNTSHASLDGPGISGSTTDAAALTRRESGAPAVISQTPSLNLQKSGKVRHSRSSSVDSGITSTDAAHRSANDEQPALCSSSRSASSWRNQLSSSVMPTTTETGESKGEVELQAVATQAGDGPGQRPGPGLGMSTIPAAADTSHQPAGVDPGREHVPVGGEVVQQQEEERPGMPGLIPSAAIPSAAINAVRVKAAARQQPKASGAAEKTVTVLAPMKEVADEGLEGGSPLIKAGAAAPLLALGLPVAAVGVAT